MIDIDNPNLPEWPGAAHVYSRAYKILEHMGQNGHVKKYIKTNVLLDV